MLNRYRLGFVLVLVLLLSGCDRPTSEYLMRGNRALENGELADASLNFRKVLQKDPKSVEAHMGLGRAALRLNDYSEAYRSFSSAVDLAPDNQDALKSLAEVALGGYLLSPQSQSLLKTRLEYVAQRLIELDPNSAEAYKILGLIASGQKRYVEALELFRKASASDPSQTSLKLLEVQALRDSGRHAEAEAAVQALILNKPDFGPAYDWLIQWLAESGRREEAERVLARKVENNPDNALFQLQLARAYMQRGQREAAKSLVENVLATGRDDSVIQVGDFYSGLGEFAIAEQFYRQGLQKDAKIKLTAQKRIAGLLGRQGRIDQALEIVRDIKKVHRNDEEAFHLEADLLARKGGPEDLRAAIVMYGALLGRRPTDAPVRYKLAMARLAQGDQNGGREELERCISTNPSYLPAIDALAGMYRRSGNFRDLLLLAERILVQDPNHVAARLLRAEALIRTGRAGEARNVLLELNGESSVAIEVGLLMAQAHAAEKNLERAEQQLRSMYRPGSLDLRVLQALSDVLLVRGSRAEVVTLWRNELARAPESVAIKRGLAKATYLAGQYESAISLYRQLAVAEPQNVESHVFLASALLASGKKAEGLEAFRKANELPGANQTVIEGLLGYLHTMDGDSPAAELYYRKILSREPDNHFALNNLAFILAERGEDLAEASSMARQAIQKDGANPEYLDTLAFVYFKQGAKAEAAKQFASLVEKHPKHPGFHYHYGLVLAELGDAARAKEEFQTALRLSPPAELEKRIKNALSSPGIH